MKPDGTLVSETFRDTVLGIYPKLQADWRYLAFLDLLVFGGFIEGGHRPEVVVTHQAVLEALGMAPNTSSKAFQSTKFINTFNKQVVGGKLRVGPYSYVHGKARTIMIDQLAHPFRTALQNEFQTFHTVPEPERVHFVSGKRWTKTTPSSLRDVHDAQAAKAPSTLPEAKRLLDYLNALPTNVFASTITNPNSMTGAIAIATSLPNPVVRRSQLALLQKIASQPKPFYGASSKDKTVRIFSRNASVLQLRNDIKHALISNWSTFDLKSAQLAIVAKDWGINSLATLLGDPSKSVWTELATPLQGVPFSIAKPAIKTAMYSIAYGGSETGVRSELDRTLSDELPGVPVDVGPFFAQPIVRDLFLTRRAALHVVRKLGAPDCFGRQLTCKTPAQARSVLAQLSQAQEMQLLLPALDLAEQRPDDFRIMLWEHDGFSVHFRRAAKRNDSTKRALIKAVNDECRRLGYLTELVQK